MNSTSDNNNLLDSKVLEKPPPKSLDLSKQSLQDLPLSLLKEFTFIKHLYLENNLLRELPEEIFSLLPLLSWLDIRNNNLVNFPKSVANHPSLEVLLLQGNQLRFLPLELGLVSNLRGLQLSGNPLEFPPQEVIEKGIHSILNFLRGECKACAKEFREELKNTHYCENKEDTIKDIISTEIKIETYQNNTCRRNTNPCNMQNISNTLNKRRTTIDGYPIKPNSTHKNEDNILMPSQQIVPLCKSAIRVMTNPKSFTTPARNSAPNLNRHKSGRMLEKTYRNATSMHNKQVLMKQDAIIQKRKNEEALKSWRDKMRTMKDNKPNNRPSQQERTFPFGTDPEFMKMPSRAFLKSSSSSNTKHVLRSSERVDISSEIDSELSVIFKTLQDLKNLKGNPSISPRSEQKAANDKLLKITELKAAIDDLKKRNSQQRIVKMVHK